MFASVVVVHDDVVLDAVKIADLQTSKSMSANDFLIRKEPPPNLQKNCRNAEI